MAPPDRGGTAPALCHHLRDGEESSRAEMVVSNPFAPFYVIHVYPFRINFYLLSSTTIYLLPPPSPLSPPQ